ncbi:OmpA family protein [Acinetobacter rudis]|uniref:OmpA family protein n=1 Tax=Acinetobacter rudis TaxID=632955 RepID=A0AAW8JBV0_9GAMM|nr:OmpA family protein [Acinetobacter rudis]MDQ8937063.1 OmpA family protein [Acinetobacter rudis]MDQ9019290.1 OmpA family protein [Acinetobacter rudis]
MRLNNKIKKIFFVTASIIFCSLNTTGLSLAQPVIVSGNVDNEEDKQTILNQVYSVYGSERVIDKIEVQKVITPTTWMNTIQELIRSDLKKVSKGKLDIHGTAVQLTGTVSHAEESQKINQLFSSLITAPYHFQAKLFSEHSEQKLLDDTLNNRVVEFESDSATLTPSGILILNQMVIALNKVKARHIRIVGHTDSSGDKQKNKQLSLQRAEAVKHYLMSQNIAATRLSVEGWGDEKPIADNHTVDGRKKNRRIEFEVL